MTPWLQDPDVTLYHGDCLEVLRELPSGSVHMCATSPPFYGLRDYGTDGQIGLEDTPDAWVANLVAVFREVRRVLRDDGSLWIELGDSFSDKQLLGQPWLLAFALRADGWWLRSEIIWARPNPMPESVTDRPTKSHSTVFLLSKQPRYFYDADAIREPHAMTSWSAAGDLAGRTLKGQHAPTPKGVVNDGRAASAGIRGQSYHPSGANARSVWQIPTEPTPFAHFATWPQALVRRMILAGTSERGCCPECGAPWVREVERVRPDLAQYQHRAGVAKYEEAGRNDAEGAVGKMSGQEWARLSSNTTVGWSPSCPHWTPVGESRGIAPPPVPCTVLDPFAGSGTTSLVARNHGRHSIGIELNEQYLRLAATRLQQLSLLA